MHLPPCRDGQLRIGVALPVPPPFGTRLQGLRARLGDPQARRTPAHVTVLGPTAVEQSDMPGVLAHLRSVAAAHAPFVVRLRGAGTFRPASPVVYAALAGGGRECADLEASVRSGLLDAPTRYPYHPHVTVAQDVPEHVLDAAVEALADLDTSFPVSTVSLYAHGDDGVWRTTCEIPLGDGPRAVSPGTA